MAREYRIEHYRVGSMDGRLRITQDQRKELRHALIAIPLMMLVIFLYGPAGPLTLNGEKLPQFWFVTFEVGFCVSLLVVLYASAYTKEHIFNKGKIRVTERRHGKLLSRYDYQFKEPVEAEYLIKDIPEPDKRPIFRYELTLSLEYDKSLRLVTNSRHNMDVLVDTMQKHMEMNITLVDHSKTT